MEDSTMEYYEDMIIYNDDNYYNAAKWCNESGEYHIDEIEKDSDGKRRFQINRNEGFTTEELAEQERVKAEREAEAQRVPDLEDATLDLASYIAELEERIAQLEAQNG